MGITYEYINNNYVLLDEPNEEFPFNLFTKPHIFQQLNLWKDAQINHIIEQEISYFQSIIMEFNEIMIKKYQVVYGEGGKSIAQNFNELAESMSNIDKARQKWTKEYNFNSAILNGENQEADASVCSDEEIETSSPLLNQAELSEHQQINIIKARNREKNTLENKKPRTKINKITIPNINSIRIDQLASEDDSVRDMLERIRLIGHQLQNPRLDYDSRELLFQEMRNINSDIEDKARPFGGLAIEDDQDEDSDSNSPSTSGLANTPNISLGIQRNINNISKNLNNLSIIDKLIKRYDKSIPKFDGDRKKFVGFYKKLLSIIDKIQYEDYIKIDVSKYFLIGEASNLVETHDFMDPSWEAFRKYLEISFMGDRKSTEITEKKLLDNINLEKGETISSLNNRLSAKLSILQFLNPTDYSDREKILKDKLLASIPSSYYYRLEDASKISLKTLITDLERIEKLLSAMEKENSNSNDPAVRNIQIADINQIQNRPYENKDYNNTNYTRDRIMNTNNAYSNNDSNWGKLELIQTAPVTLYPLYTCLIHKNHIRRDCPTVCGFCNMRGSHVYSDCYNKTNIGMRFVKEKIDKFGETADSVAKSLIKEKGILRVTDNCFKQLLKQKWEPVSKNTYEGYKQRERL